MEWQIPWNMDQHKRVAAEKEQQARREALAAEARKERDAQRQRSYR
jgi:hypothetical protein